VLKFDKLLKQTGSIQEFVAKRISQDQEYLGINKALKEFDELIKVEKLIFQIVSHDLSQAQSFHNLLALSSEMRDSYQLRMSGIPEFPSSNVPDILPALTFQPSSDSQLTVRYELKTSQAHIIGRNPAIAQLLLPDYFHLTSGTHAELRFLEGCWQVKDSGSRNGTFINGNPQKLRGWHTLKADDQIFLGDASQVAGSAALTFNIPSKDDIHPAHAEAQRLLNCHILCLVIPPQPLSENVQHFIQLAKDTQFVKFLIIVDKPGGATSDTFKETIATIENSVKDQLQSAPFELVSLLLKPFTASSGATVIAPHSQPNFEQLYEGLKGLSQENTESTIANWGTHKLNQIIDQIEVLLVQKDTDLKRKLQSDEERFKELSQRNLKKQVEKVYKKVDGERDSFFRQVKAELSQSKASLLDEFRQSSIFYKIQQFAKQTQPKVSDQGSYRCVRLQMQTKKTDGIVASNVHAAATKLCHTELTRWTTSEWNRIRSEYSGGGLDALFKKSYEALNFMPELVLPKDGFLTSQTLSVQSLLSASNVEPTLELRYKQVGFLGYMSKTLRTNVMTILGMVTMFGGGLIAFNKAILIPPLIPIVIAVAFISYRQEEEVKIDEASQKLQKEVASYYQSYSKGVVDRLNQRIGNLLDSEERGFREALENVKEVYALHIATTDKAQSQLKSQLDEMKRSGQSKIDKDLADLRKLKQSL
jgi:hypothetical protein